MKDKCWAFILMGIILLASFAVFFTYENAIEKYSKIAYEKGYEIGYDNKICEICDEKICVCVCPQPNLDELCKGSPITWCGPDKTGHWEIINGKCQWVCS